MTTFIVILTPNTFSLYAYRDPISSSLSKTPMIGPNVVNISGNSPRKSLVDKAADISALFRLRPPFATSHNLAPPVHKIITHRYPLLRAAVDCGGST